MRIINILILILIVMSSSFGVELDQEISEEDKETFDNILEPLAKIYSFVKYTATLLAALFLLFAGISFLMSGNDKSKRENAKDMATYVIIGLLVIWIAPIVVEYLTS